MMGEPIIFYKIKDLKLFSNFTISSNWSTCKNMKQVYGTIHFYSRPNENIGQNLSYNLIGKKIFTSLRIFLKFLRAFPNISD